MGPTQGGKTPEASRGKIQLPLVTEGIREREVEDVASLLAWGPTLFMVCFPSGLCLLVVGAGSRLSHPCVQAQLSLSWVSEARPGAAATTEAALGFVIRRLPRSGVLLGARTR